MLVTNPFTLCLFLPRYSASGPLGFCTLLAEIFSCHAQKQHCLGSILNEECQGLLLRYLIEALVEEVLFEHFFMLTKFTTKAIVGIEGWALFVKTHHAERTAIEQIEATILI